MERNFKTGNASLNTRIQGWFVVFSVVAAFGFLMQPVSAARLADEHGALPEEGKLAIDLQPFEFSMIQRGRLRGRVSLTLTLVVDQQRDSEMIRERLPQIRADFLSALTTLSRQRFDINQPIDPDIVRAFLTPYLEYRLGAKKAQVYVKHAMITPN